ENGNWWLQVQDQVLGYWPGSIFNYLASNATKINWGGEVYNSEPNGDSFVDGRRIETMKNKGFIKQKGTIKTIEGEDGDTIDCVDIYQQPAFDHPFLKNHVIQMKPSSIPGGAKMNSSQSELFQDWHKCGQCPKGTIPIRRAQQDEYPRGVKWIPRKTQLNHSFYDSSHHEHAIVDLEGGQYYGARASLNVWNPVVYDGDVSIAQIWVTAGPSNDINSIEAGWKVNAPDKKTRLFIYWTSDGYKRTGCYNLQCPGFVQVNHKYALDSLIKPLSSYAAKQFDIGITVYKKNGNWWLQVQDQVLGYWPGSIFNYLARKATRIHWGEEVYNSEPTGHHTKTQMGSGHFGNEGYGKASYFRNIGYMDNSGKFRDVEAQSLNPYATRPFCYNVVVSNNTLGGFRTHIYFGGPGYSTLCAGEDGDIIDCVDIYQQPSFDHPFLKNHTIQMKPSSIPDELFQDWHKSGQCPKGTIPIRRTQQDEYPRSVKGMPHRTQPNHSFYDSSHHEYATVDIEGGIFYGGRAILNVWNPVVYDGDFSVAQIWVSAGPIGEVNIVEAGWRVNSPDKKTRLFIYWTSKGYKRKGCYNLECPGFVQVNHKVAFGSVIKPISRYSAQQFEIVITIYKSPDSHWWLMYPNEAVGYWPVDIFEEFGDYATHINFGGKIYNSKPGGIHTSTQMGSGRFPSEGFGRACFIRNIRYLNNNRTFVSRVPTCSYRNSSNNSQCKNCLCHTFYDLNMPLKDPHLCDALKVQVQITGASQVQDTYAATLHYQLAYRLQNHAFDMVVPDMAQTNDALSIQVYPRMTPMCMFVPRQLTRDQMTSLFPESWITKYEEHHQTVKLIQSNNPFFIRKESGKVETRFVTATSKKKEVTIVQTQMAMLQPISYAFEKGLTIKGFHEDGKPCYEGRSPSSHYGGISVIVLNGEKKKPMMMTIQEEGRKNPPNKS
ncbi:hypothetical protein SO802_005335, partial [Lithocarpus litseifolius]